MELICQDVSEKDIMQMQKHLYRMRFDCDEVRQEYPPEYFKKAAGSL